MNLCDPCLRGVHSHDTWGPNAPEVRRGEQRVGDDAGCSNVVGPSTNQIECECPHVNPPKSKRAHPHCPTCRCGD